MLQVTLDVKALPSSICTDIIDGVAPSLLINQLRSVGVFKMSKIFFLNDENTNKLFFFSCNIRIRHLVNDLSIFVSCAVPRNKTFFFFSMFPQFLPSETL